jgi:hypothetical protein
VEAALLTKVRKIESRKLQQIWAMLLDAVVGSQQWKMMDWIWLDLVGGGRIESTVVGPFWENTSARMGEKGNGVGGSTRVGMLTVMQ